MAYTYPELSPQGLQKKHYISVFIRILHNMLMMYINKNSVMLIILILILLMVI